MGSVRVMAAYMGGGSGRSQQRRGEEALDCPSAPVRRAPDRRMRRFCHRSASCAIVGPVNIANRPRLRSARSLLPAARDGAVGAPWPIRRRRRYPPPAANARAAAGRRGRGRRAVDGRPQPPVHAAALAGADRAERARARARADRPAPGDRAGRRHDLHRPGLIPPRPRTTACSHEISFDDWSGAPVDLFVPVNPIYTDLRRGLVRYASAGATCRRSRSRPGPPSSPGSTGERVACLARSGSGLRPATRSTPRWPRGSRYQAAHGLKADGDRRRRHDRQRSTAARAYYEQLIIINMERAGACPRPRSSAAMRWSMPAARACRCRRTAGRSTA